MFLTKQFLFSQRGNRGRKVKWDRKQDALTVRLPTNEIVTIRLLSHQSFFLFGPECPSNALGGDVCFLCRFQSIKVHNGRKETHKQEFNADNILLLL